MKRVNEILNHDLFLESLAKTGQAEEARKFCGHTMPHLLDVARIALIFSMEEGVQLPVEQVYAAALLHDIGRWRQYEDGTPHELASVDIAEPILRECGFDNKETSVILEAIGSHRTPGAAGGKNLSGILYRADKASRCCFACKAEPECGWKRERKNSRLVR